MGSISLLDPDEGMYGAIAREMVEKGDWITPHFNGVRYLEKPPLYFWLTAIATAFFGPTEWAIRLWSTLPTLGTAILCWQIGRFLYGGRTGLLSAIIFVTSIGVFRYARVAATDSLLVFSLTLSLYGFVKARLSQRSIVNGQWGRGRGRTIDYLRLTFDSPPGSLVFWLGIALGMLSKGLVGIFLPFLIVGLYLWFSGERVTPKEMHLKWGLPFFLVLTVPWHLLAAWKNPGFFEFYVMDNQFLRFFSDRAFLEDDVPVTTIAFVGLTFIWFFPWSLFLSATLRQGFPDRRSVSPPQEKLRLLVGLWAVAVIGFFALSSSTLEHYILPALPPLSLMVGVLWAEAVGAPKPLPSLKWLLVASAIGCGLVGVALILWADRLTSNGVFSWLAELNVYYRILKDQGMPFPFPSVAPFVPLAKGLGIVLAIGLPLAMILFCLRKPWASFIAVTGVAAGVAVMVLRLDFVMEPHHSTKSVALALKTRAQKGEIIVHEGPLEYSGGLPFYSGRQIYVLNGKRGDLDFGSRYPEGRDLFLNDGDFARLWKGNRRVFFVTRLMERENALKKLSLENVFLLGRYGSRSLYSNHGP